MDEAERDAVHASFDGSDVRVDLRSFSERIRAAGDVVGWPAFLRTDHLSAKHDWGRACFLDDPGDVLSNVMTIVEYNEMVDWIGSMPWTGWAVREFLPTIPVGICHGYVGMPICREFRFFVDDGVARCHHPYWPRRALDEGRAEFHPGFDQDAFDTLTAEERTRLRPIVERAGAAVGGSWSIDVLETRRGWFVTDMALAAESFHVRGADCSHDAPNPPEEERVGIDPGTLLA